MARGVGCEPMSHDVSCSAETGFRVKFERDVNLTPCAI